MATPLLFQALELSNLLSKTGPYFQHPYQWNSKEQKFEAVNNIRQNMIWFLSSIVYMVAMLILLIFLVAFGLHTPENNKFENWLVTLEILPLALHIILYNWKFIDKTASCNIYRFYNCLIKISMDNLIATSNIGMNNKRKFVDFIHPIIEGILSLPVP